MACELKQLKLPHFISNLKVNLFRDLVAEMLGDRGKLGE